MQQLKTGFSSRSTSSCSCVILKQPLFIFHYFLVVANSIIQQIVYGAARNETYNRIADVVDRFGSRFTGTPNLEHAIGTLTLFLAKSTNEPTHDKAF